MVFLTFKNVATAEGLKDLNEFLADESYISGFYPTQADAKVAKAIGSAPSASEYPNVARWFSQITSLGADAQKSWPAEKVSVVFAEGAVAAAPAAAAAAPAADDEDLDLFAEDTQEEIDARNAARTARQADKEKLRATSTKSSIVLDVKPWDDETDLKAMEAAIRSINIDGLTWGASRFVEIGYGIKKMQIMATVIDELVAGDDIEDAVTGFSDLVQSMDIDSWNKI